MFSSGMDTAELGALAADPARLHEWRASILQIWNLCEDMSKPTIAQIHGACLGGAAELVLACDMRVMAADAVIGLVETRIGLIPDVGGCSRLPALVGLGRAKELIMASKVIDGTEAERIGLVNRVAPPEGLDAATAQLAGELLACAPLAVGLAKGVLNAAARPALARHARAGGRRAGALRDERGLPRGRAGAGRAPPAAVQRALKPRRRRRGRAPDMLAGALPEPVSIIGASGALGFGLAAAPRPRRLRRHARIARRRACRADRRARPRGGSREPRRGPRQRDGGRAQRARDPLRAVSQPVRDAAQPARRAAPRPAARRLHGAAGRRGRRQGGAHRRRLAGLGGAAGAGDGAGGRHGAAARCTPSARRRCATSTTRSTRTSCCAATGGPTSAASRP